MLPLVNEKDQARFVSRYQEGTLAHYRLFASLCLIAFPTFNANTVRTSEKTCMLARIVLDDYVRGLSIGYPTPTFSVHTAALSRFQLQVAILASGRARLSDILADIRGLLQADLFDSQIDAARHLRQNGRLRAAGVWRALCWRAI